MWGSGTGAPGVKENRSMRSTRGVSVDALQMEIEGGIGGPLRSTRSGALELRR
jgi:hypothetical protein